MKIHPKYPQHPQYPLKSPNYRLHNPYAQPLSHKKRLSRADEWTSVSPWCWARALVCYRQAAELDPAGCGADARAGAEACEAALGVDDYGGF
jgi:hypothetical protein